MTSLVVALAIVLRIAWVLAVPTKPVGDFAMYVESAAHLVEHGSLDQEYVYMPGYIFLIAPVQALGGGWLATKLVGAVLGGLGAGAVAGITRRLCGSARAALVAGLICAFWPAGIAIASVTGTDMPAAVMVILAAYVLVRFSKERPVLAAILFGLLTGLAAYIRAIVVPLAGLSVLVFRAQGQPWRKSLGCTAVACSIALLALSPWALRNRLRYGETFFTDSHGGLTALVGANPNTDGCYSRSLNRTFHDVTGFKLLAEPHRDADRASMVIAKDWIRFDLLFTVGLLASKAERLLVHERALLYWPLFRAGVLPEPQRSFFARHRSAIEQVADLFWLSVLALALMGIALAALRRQWLALALLPQAAVLAALYTAIFAEPRYRLPIFMLLVPFAVIALEWLWRTARAGAARTANPSWKREGLVAVGVAATVFACAPALAWAGARLREHHRWAVHECSIDGHVQYCKWRALRADGDLEDVPALRGVWNGVGLALASSSNDPPTTMTGETELSIEPGDYAVDFSVDVAPDNLAEVTGELSVAVNGRPMGDFLSLDSVAAAARQGRSVPWTRTLHHDGGSLRLQVGLRHGTGHRQTRIWLSDSRDPLARQSVILVALQAKPSPEQSDPWGTLPAGPMAEPLASKPAIPRRKVSSPGYPVLIALALSLPMAACGAYPAGVAPSPFRDAGTAVDTAAAGLDVSIDHSNEVRIDGGTFRDAESETALDAQSSPMNSDPAGIVAYVFTPTSDASSDDVP